MRAVTLRNFGLGLKTSKQTNQLSNLVSRDTDHGDLINWIPGKECQNRLFWGPERSPGQDSNYDYEHNRKILLQRRIIERKCVPFRWHRDICTDLRCRSHHPLPLTVFPSSGPQSSHLFHLPRLARFLGEKTDRWLMNLQNGSHEDIKSSIFYCDEPWGTNPRYVLGSTSTDHFFNNQKQQGQPRRYHASRSSQQDILS